MTTTTEWMGWRPDIPSHRDFRLGLMAETKAELTLDLTKPSIFAPKFEKQPVFNQGPRGSCVGQSCANLHGYERKVTARSALFVYFEARRKIGETNVDNGAYIRDGVAVLSELGAPRDDLWPDQQENLFLDPFQKADIDASKRRIYRYYRVEETSEKLACLASGHPFVIGATVFPSWETDQAEQTGWIPMPGQSEPMIGGHAFVAYRREANFPQTQWGQKLAALGIAVSQAAYRCRNSWGDWGDEGDFWIPAEYIENLWLADDAWTVRKI